MWKNYIKIAIRNIKRQKIYSFINITGLAVGIAISLTLTLYVVDDLTFDRFHEDAESIFRFTQTDDVAGLGTRISAITAGPMAPTAKQELPEVIAAARTYAYDRLPIRRIDEERQRELEEDAIRARVLVTDPDFFDVFSFEILEGKEGALENPNGILITPELAEAIFADEDPMGRALQVPTVESAYVAGIVKAPPVNSHIQFDMIIPLRVETNPVWWGRWENQTLSGYVKLQQFADPAQVASKMQEIARSRGYPDIFTVGLQPLLDIHLKSMDYYYDYRNFGKTDIAMIVTLTIIGIMILLIAAFNFINLTSARAAKRAREVGMRKVVGGQRWQLIAQFLLESILMTMLSMVLAVTILLITLPRLADFLGKRIDVGLFANPVILLALIVTAVAVGLLSGAYPALILSSFRPIKVLRGEFQSTRSGILLRRILVVFQFTVTIALIFSVSSVLMQVRYLRSRNMGYNREQVLIAPAFLREQSDALKNRLESTPGVLSLGQSSRLPASSFMRAEVRPEGFGEDETSNWPTFYIDEGFLPTLDVSMAQGRNFSQEFRTDAEEAVLINEEAARFIGWEDPVGKRLSITMDDTTVITRRIVGVVKDFHYATARHVIDPMVFLYQPQRAGILMIRLAEGQIPETLAKVEAVYNELFPEFNFQYRFADDIFNEQFAQDREFASHIAFFSGVAIFIACLGLLGLASFAVEQRQKEIAIRKIIGCSDRKIVMHLANDFLKWVLLANIFAWPIGYLSMQRWLDGFVYKIPFGVIPFLLSGVSALFIALLTISFQSIRAAHSNPAATLRQGA
jgi:putative ABC transport system permease protein